jgi:hypothetical protein
MSVIQAYAPTGYYSTFPKSLTASSEDGSKSTSIFGGNSRQQAPVTRAASVSAEYMSSDKMELQYTNKDGDSVTLNLEHVEYQKTQMLVQSSTTSGASDDQWQKIVDKLMDEFTSLKEEVLKKFVSSLTRGESDGTQQIDHQPATQATDETKAADVPEYWNAENTSQRIVDFALSFVDGSQGANSDFLKSIKDAIDAGFKQAKDILGDMPSSVNKLVQDTYDLTMKKLDDWAKSQGIDTSVQDETATQVQSQVGAAQTVTA